MKQYKVQWAYGDGIGVPNIHNDEESAAAEVAHLLGTWLRRQLTSYVTDVVTNPAARSSPELTVAAEMLIPQLRQLIFNGQVWDAYALWEDFYLRFENVMGYPLYVMFGTVIVQGSRGTGLSNRIPFIQDVGMRPIDKYIKGPSFTTRTLDLARMKMLDELLPVIINKAGLKGIKITQKALLEALKSSEQAINKSDYYYMDEEAESRYIAELREGVLRRLFPKPTGMGLGAMRSWLVQYADFGGMLHPSRHMNEGRAKIQAQEYLEILLHSLEMHSSTEGLVGKNLEYVKEAGELIHHVQYLLDNGYVWSAYLDYKAFERKWNNQFDPFTLELSIGSMRVIPEPEYDAV